MLSQFPLLRLTVPTSSGTVWNGDICVISCVNSSKEKLGRLSRPWYIVAPGRAALTFRAMSVVARRSSCCWFLYSYIMSVMVVLTALRYVFTANSHTVKEFQNSVSILLKLRTRVAHFWFTLDNNPGFALPYIHVSVNALYSPVTTDAICDAMTSERHPVMICMENFQEECIMCFTASSISSWPRSCQL